MLVKENLGFTQKGNPYNKLKIGGPEPFTVVTTTFNTFLDVIYAAEDAYMPDGGLEIKELNNGGFEYEDADGELLMMNIKGHYGYLYQDGVELYKLTIEDFINLISGNYPESLI